MAYYVYLISTFDSNFVKIGVTCDITTRLRQLQSGNPHRLVPVRLIKLETEEDARTLEALFHHRYKEYRRAGEWFAIAPGDILSDINFALSLVEFIHTQQIYDLTVSGEYKASVPYANFSVTRLTQYYHAESSLTLEELIREGTQMQRAYLPLSVKHKTVDPTPVQDFAIPKNAETIKEMRRGVANTLDGAAQMLRVLGQEEIAASLLEQRAKIYAQDTPEDGNPE